MSVALDQRFLESLSGAAKGTVSNIFWVEVVSSVVITGATDFFCGATLVAVWVVGLVFAIMVLLVAAEAEGLTVDFTGAEVFFLSAGAHATNRALIRMKIGIFTRRLGLVFLDSLRGSLFNNGRGLDGLPYDDLGLGKGLAIACTVTGSLSRLRGDSTAGFRKYSVLYLISDLQLVELTIYVALCSPDDVRDLNLHRYLTGAVTDILNRRGFRRFQSLGQGGH